MKKVSPDFYLNNFVNLSKIVTHNIFLETGIRMARVTKHNRDREDDDMDLDDRRQAKRARQASNKVDSTGGNGDMRSRRAEGPRETISSTSRQSSAFHAQALARNLPQMAVVDNPLHPTIKKSVLLKTYFGAKS